MSSYPCRCTRDACRKRQTKLKHPNEYARTPRCIACRQMTVKVDRYRCRVENRNPCRCYGYSFPHAKGRGWCDHNPRVTTEMLQEREQYMGARYA